MHAKTKRKICRILGWVSTSIAAIVVIATLAIVIGIAILQTYQWEPTFNRHVHSHMENAYDASTPELMREELRKAVAGMRALNLHPSIYSDTRPWMQTSSTQMAYQYAHMEAIIERTEDVIKWRDQSQRTGQGDQLNDVYNSKMEALRHFMRTCGAGESRDCWSDSIAHGAFYAKHHPIAAVMRDFSGYIGTGILASVSLLGGGGLALISNSRSR